MTQQQAIQNILAIPLMECPSNPVHNSSTCRFYAKDYGCLFTPDGGYIAHKWGCTFVTDTEYISITQLLKKAETSPKEKFVGINTMIRKEKINVKQY